MRTLIHESYAIASKLVIEIQVPVIRLEKRKCSFPSERQSEGCLFGFPSRKRFFCLMLWIYIKTDFLALLCGRVASAPHVVLGTDQMRSCR